MRFWYEYFDYRQTLTPVRIKMIMKDTEVWYLIIKIQLKIN